MTVLSSTSENNALALLSLMDLKVYSVGISTGGSAEIRMAAHSKRQIIATTIDPEGADFAQAEIEKAGLSEQIEVKLEDISQRLPYSPGCFDFIYARLVLHYLPKNLLEAALTELHRVLKKGGKLFVVVRSVDCPEAQGSHISYDPATCMTTYFSNHLPYSRYFHSETSIQRHLISAGFAIEKTSLYQERLCSDFQRTKLATHVDSLIEVVAIHP